MNVLTRGIMDCGRLESVTAVLGASASLRRVTAPRLTEVLDVVCSKAAIDATAFKRSKEQTGRELMQYELIRKDGPPVHAFAVLLAAETNVFCRKCTFPPLHDSRVDASGILLPPSMALVLKSLRFLGTLELQVPSTEETALFTTEHMPALQHLILDDSPAEFDSCVHISRCSRLVTLSMARTYITRDGCAGLEQLLCLREINISSLWLAARWNSPNNSVMPLPPSLRHFSARHVNLSRNQQHALHVGCPQLCSAAFSYRSDGSDHLILDEETVCEYLTSLEVFLAHGCPGTRGSSLARFAPYISNLSLSASSDGIAMCLMSLFPSPKRVMKRGSDSDDDDDSDDRKKEEDRSQGRSQPAAVIVDQLDVCHHLKFINLNGLNPPPGLGVCCPYLRELLLMPPPNFSIATLREILSHTKRLERLVMTFSASLRSHGNVYCLREIIDCVASGCAALRCLKVVVEEPVRFAARNSPPPIVLDLTAFATDACPNLRELDLKDNRRLKVLRGGRGFRQLRKLNVSGTAVRDIDDFFHVASLEEICFRSSDVVLDENVWGKETHPSLKRVETAGRHNEVRAVFAKNNPQVEVVGSSNMFSFLRG